MLRVLVAYIALEEATGHPVAMLPLAQRQRESACCDVGCFCRCGHRTCVIVQTFPELHGISPPVESTQYRADDMEPLLFEALDLGLVTRHKQVVAVLFLSRFVTPITMIAQRGYQDDEVQTPRHLLGG